MQITDVKNTHRGRCFILGNGPSLKGFDFSRIQNEITFGTNRIYLSGHIPDYYVCVNDLVLSQFEEEIGELDTIKFLSRRYPVKNKRGKVIELDTSENQPIFRMPEDPIWEGHTVTYAALQLAFYMGFEKVILLGVDHDYGEIERPNEEEVKEGPDEFHFHPDYFKGVKWHTPDLERNNLAYSLAKTAYQRHGRQIVNCTERTKLEVFPILPLNHVIGPGFRVSCVISAYYAEKYITGCLENIQNQQGELPEIVVICQKGSAEERAAKDYQAHQVITTEDIPNLATAWNLGAKAAHGKYIIPACTDDRLRPDALRVMADVLDARPEIDIVYADVFVSWEDNADYETFIAKHKTVVGGRVEGQPGIYAWPEYNRGTLGRNCYLGPQPLYRANLHQRFGWFDETFTSAMDYEFWLRCAKGNNYLHIPDVLGVYQARPDSLEYRTKTLSIQESEIARRRYGSNQIGITPMGEEVRIEAGDCWGYVARKDLKQLAVKL